LLQHGLPCDGLLQALESFNGVPGRMERVPHRPDQPAVLVDYAHTPDGLDNALQAARPFAEGKLICVFGCGGDRDRSKRAPMMEAAIKGADRIVVTSDNPRTESQEQIFDDMRIALGAADAARVQFIPDRKRAISTALDLAEAGDCVLVAGKGHESYQEFDGSVIPFDDRQVIRELWDLKSKDATGK
ncbi:MAG: glutamate ligase domain-containing protein, partial [Opitutales bacterium]